MKYLRYVMPKPTTVSIFQKKVVKRFQRVVPFSAVDLVSERRKVMRRNMRTKPSHTTGWNICVNNAIDDILTLALGFCIT